MSNTATVLLTINHHQQVEAYAIVEGGVTELQAFHPSKARLAFNHSMYLCKKYGADLDTEASDVRVLGLLEQEDN